MDAVPAFPSLPVDGCFDAAAGASTCIVLDPASPRVPDLAGNTPYPYRDHAPAGRTTCLATVAEQRAAGSHAHGRSTV